MAPCALTLTVMTRTDRSLPAPPLDPARLPRWIRVDQAARACSVSARTIRRWIAAGHLKASRPANGRVIVDRDSLIDFVEQGML